MGMMDSRSILFRFGQILALGAATVCPSQIVDVLHSPIDDGTAVRLFFNSGDYFHAPLIFRVVSESDPRLNTAPLLPEGRTAYISHVEMQHLKQGLAELVLRWPWKQSREVMAFGDAMSIPAVGAMVIIVVSSQGTAEGGLDSTRICNTLAPLDSALRTPRALWEFQLFRDEYKCDVPGLNGQAFPDHWPWNQPKK
jgi:hypothetical protein